MKLSCKGPVSFLVKSLQLHPMVTSTLQAWAPLFFIGENYPNMDEHWHHLMEFFSKIDLANLLFVYCICVFIFWVLDFPFTADIMAIMAIDSSFVSWSPCRIWMYLVHHPHRHFFYHPRHPRLIHRSSTPRLDQRFFCQQDDSQTGPRQWRTSGRQETRNPAAHFLWDQDSSNGSPEALWNTYSEVCVS